MSESVTAGVNIAGPVAEKMLSVNHKEKQFEEALASGKDYSNFWKQEVETLRANTHASTAHLTPEQKKNYSLLVDRAALIITHHGGQNPDKPTGSAIERLPGQTEETSIATVLESLTRQMEAILSPKVTLNPDSEGPRNA